MDEVCERIVAAFHARRNELLESAETVMAHMEQVERNLGVLGTLGYGDKAGGPVDDKKPKLPAPTEILRGEGANVSLSLFRQTALSLGYPKNIVTKTVNRLDDLPPGDTLILREGPESDPEANHEYVTFVNMPALVEEYTSGRFDKVPKIGVATSRVVGQVLDAWAVENDQYVGW